MKPEDQRRAIAEFCGFTKQQIDAFYKAEAKGIIMGVLFIPDYLNDLNAIHEAEKLIVADLWFEYQLKLKTGLREGKDTVIRLFHATAAQKAEALLKTIEKWVS